MSKYDQVNKGCRIYKEEIDARRYASYREKRFKIKPCVYQSIGKEWVVLY